jgi:hypothetical protein
MHEGGTPGTRGGAVQGLGVQRSRASPCPSPHRPAQRCTRGAVQGLPFPLPPPQTRNNFHVPLSCPYHTSSCMRHTRHTRGAVKGLGVRRSRDSPFPLPPPQAHRPGARAPFTCPVSYLGLGQEGPEVVPTAACRRNHPLLTSCPHTSIPLQLGQVGPQEHVPTSAPQRIQPVTKPHQFVYCSHPSTPRARTRTGRPPGARPDISPTEDPARNYRRITLPSRRPAKMFLYQSAPAINN